MAPSSPAPNGFPGGFSWGTASSATQCQGATSADNWWAWEQAGKAPRSGDGNGFDNLYASDFALLAGWGFSDHRLSLDWARIEPQPGRHDQEAVEHYRHILQAGRDAGLAMWVCLLHTALPTWFASEGGFLSPGASATWARHVDFIAETFGDLADGWMPVNNPTAYAQKGYLAGTFPPGHTSQEEFLTVLQAIHQADFEAALRLRQDGKPTSTNEALLPLHPADDSADAAAATALVDAVVWDSWLNLARTPRYENAFDQYGFSYYFTPTVGPSGDLFPYPEGEPVGPQGYVSWAPGLGEVLDRLNSELPGKRFLVAEIGYGGEDDRARAAYLQDALGQVHDAMSRGMDITGVHLWTGVDNYEWLEGHTVSFGLFDRHRTPRPSARLVQSLIRK
ncbi:family 1 glycosylhydrolase [Streptomyces sp. 891-h]|uniref:family 1 glycosylhydrolase n=1 Tax=Streptomyces sp. 891-h TaxID=2720714 RepID=UPI001FAA0A23|nr:family 1 glycosylhydrolase [Streptomyces sp. 891-h]UNZ18159.1 glycoside hydrolase family 1 protein [Streptomyces sp. 891-h]